jgi:DNA-binding transcriptional LysR family regulator
VAAVDLVEALRSFHAVAIEKSFTRGARRCGQPQPVTSRRIAGLEDHLGVQLLVRTSRQVEISPSGLRLLPIAEAVLTQVDLMEGMFAPARQIVVAVPVALAPQARSAIRRGLADRHIRFLDSDPEGRAAALESGLAQLGLLAVAPDEAEIRVPLGLAHHDQQPDSVRHLDRLRRSPRDRLVPPRVIQLRPEDDVPAIREPLTEAGYQAGLRMDQFAFPDSEVEAWTQVFEHDHLVLCSAGEAAAQGLGWSTLVRPSSCRSYRLAGGFDPAATERGELLRRLAAGLGGVRVEPSREA